MCISFEAKFEFHKPRIVLFKRKYGGEIAASEEKAFILVVIARESTTNTHKHRKT